MELKLFNALQFTAMNFILLRVIFANLNLLAKLEKAGYNFEI